MKRSLIIARLLFATLIYAPNLFGQAQIPVERFGVGITVGPMNARNSSLGIHGAYALSEEFHVGTQFGFAVGSNGATQGSDHYWMIAPYAKILFPIRNEFTPILVGQFILDNGGTSVEYVPGQEYELARDTRSSIFVGGGAEYFPSSSLGIYAYVGFVDVGLSTDETYIGLLQPRAGLEWFFR